MPLGSTVSPSQEVTILLGTGNSATFIPSTVGMTEAQARSNLEDAGFSVKVKKVHSSKPKGTVVSTSPKEKANKGDTVTIMVSDGTSLAMPNVRGLSQEEAERQLRAAGWDGTLTVKKVRSTNFSKAGQVKDQSPEPGSDITENATIVLQVYDVSLF